MAFRSLHAPALALLLAAAILGCGIAAHAVALRLGLTSAAEQANDRAGLYASTVEQAVDRFSYLSQLLARDPRVLAMLERPVDPERLATANAYLAETAASAGAADLFVMDWTGLTIAASNHGQPLSFIGKNYAFRPYFEDALRRGTGRFYAIGVTTGEPGYFLSQRIGPAHAPLGVAVVKIGLADLEREWGAARETVLLADGHGVVFLASHPAWLYRPVRALSAETLIRIASAAQYSGQDLSRPPLLAPEEGPLPLTVTVDDPDQGGSERVIATRHLDAHGWNVYVLAGTEAIRRQAWLAGIVAGLAALALPLAGIAWRSRRQAVRAMMLSRDRLETLVAARTRDLSEANARLEEEIVQRRAAQESLRRTQDELIQASKLSALGHMSAAIAHEINQPLSALRTYVASTLRLLEVGRGDLVEGNLARIDGLVSRMATITGDLKLFARKDPGDLRPVEVTASLRRVLALAEPRLREMEVGLVFEPPVFVPAVRASPTRLDQVFLNLVTNALDAMRDSPRRELTVRVAAGPEEVTVTCQDTGAGIAPEHRASLFDPFFTTKEVGEGVGLGLSISHAIVESFGGALAVEHRDPGTIFLVRLQRADVETRPALAEAAQ